MTLSKTLNLGLVFLIIIFMSNTSFSEDSDDFILKADSLYDTFDYESSIYFYKKACELDSSNYEYFLKLSRSLNLFGELVTKDSQQVIFEQARDAALHSIGLNNDNADTHFQLARALGKIALFKGVFKSVSLAKKVREECLKTLALDSLHDGAWHILGRWHREVSKKPKIIRAPMGLGAANKKKAVSFLQKAIEIDPNNVNHRLEMGITFLKYGNKNKAKDEFEKCLSIFSDNPLDKKYQILAKKHLAEIE